MCEAGVVPVNPGIGGVLEQFFIGVYVAKFTQICVNEFLPPDFRPCAGKVFCPQVAVALKGQIEMVVVRYFEDAFERFEECFAEGHGKNSCEAKEVVQDKKKGTGDWGLVSQVLIPSIFYPARIDHQLSVLPKFETNMRKSEKSTVPDPSRSKVVLAVPKAPTNRRKS